jgi:enoyl-CoA hydratase/carnithine racemase
MGFNRPQKKNAFTRAMLAELAAAYGELDADPELRCGLVFAHGNDFTAGLDLGDVAPAIMQGEGLAPAGSIDPWATHGSPCKKPIVVAAHGLCFTLGIELILAADVTVAAVGTRLAQIEIKRGIFPFGGGTYRWVERVGWGNAMRYLLTADELTAEEALRIGLVQAVVEKDQLLDHALAIATRIAAQAPLGVQATLQSARTARDHGQAAAASALMPHLLELMKSEDAQEGFQSFMERRANNFKGK